MRKEFIRRRAIHRRKNCRSYAKIQRFLEQKYHVRVSCKTLKRWWKLYCRGWRFNDKSRRPLRLRPSVPNTIQQTLIALRTHAGYGSYQLKNLLERRDMVISESSIKRLIKKAGLSRGSKIEGEKQSYVRWQRDHPNTLWQLDGTQLDDMSWRLPIIDDCSRYGLGVFFFESMTTKNVISALEHCILKYGKPQQILTDNGSEFGGNGEGDNDFDRWCESHHIHHIRSAIHKPTTTGKIERFHHTMNQELPYTNNDTEHFRYRYNHIRPHRSLFGKTPAEVYHAFHKLF